MVDLVGRYSRYAYRLRPVKRALLTVSQTGPERTHVAPVVPYRVQVRLVEGEIEVLVAGYLSGMSGRQLAEQFGLARSTVMDILRQHGVVVRHPRVSPEQTALAIELYRQGWRQVDIAREIGLSKSHVWHVLRRGGAL